MIDTAAEFIRGRADALFVIRGGEDTIGYRFYRKSGHSDLCHASTFSGAATRPAIRPTREPTARIEEVDRRSWIESEQSLHQLYHGQFGGFGGGRHRAEAYWRDVFTGHVFKSRPWRQYLARDRQGAIIGYAVVVTGTWRDLDDPHIYELVGSTETVVESMIRHIQTASKGGNLRVPSVSLANPVRPVLVRLGLTEERSQPQIMARIVEL